MDKGRFAWLRPLLTFVVVTMGCVPLTYFVAVTVCPPVSAEGHRFMPIGQVALAIVVGPLLGIVAALVAGVGRRR